MLNGRRGKGAEGEGAGKIRRVSLAKAGKGVPCKGMKEKKPNLWAGGYIAGILLTGACIASAGASTTVTLEGAWQERVALEDLTGGEQVAYERYGLGVDWARGGEGGQLALNGRYEWTEADWEASGASGWEGALFEEVESLELGGVWSRRINERWGGSLFAGLKDSVAGKSLYGGGDTGDGLQVSLGVGARYAFGRGFAVTLGAQYQDNPGGMDDDLWPYIGIYWRITEEWTLRTRNGVIVDYAAGVDGSLVISGSILYESREYYLGEDGPVEVMYEEEGLELGLTVRWEVAPGWALEPYVQYAVAREATLWEDDREVVESDLGDGAGFGLRVGWSF